MKEAPTRKLPPKPSGGGSTSSTPTKTGNDEILSTLLRINNFDSISSIKDESLDIDLSACVPISADPTGMMNGNSLSTADFWRVLDESAQNSQLDLTTGSDDSMVSRDVPGDYDPAIVCMSPNRRKVGEVAAKKVQSGVFSDTFLRPEPPSPMSFSPFKRSMKLTLLEQPQQRKVKTPIIVSASEINKLKMSIAIKEEPPEQLLADDGDSHESTHDGKTISTNCVNGNTFGGLLVPAVAKIEIETGPPALQPIGGSKRTEESQARASIPQQPLYKCLDCDGLLLVGEQQLSTHALAAHRIHFKCNECERDFEQEAGLKKHIRTHRSMEARKDAWKKCPDCGKCLKLGSMWMHRKIHSDNKKYGCDICGQKFVQKINLTHHSRVHTAEKPYECPECQKRFQERSNLQRHQKYHAETRSYRCDKCGKMYKTERCLKVHNLVHLEQRPFACTVCEKSFISNSKLKQHSNIHTGERPFKCNYCPRDFTNFPNWLKHTRRRHKVDHKTGEHLENIPSYCSKKSTKTKKTDEANASKTTNITKTVTSTSTVTTASTTTANSANHPATIAATTTTKAPVKRKKKVTPPLEAAVVGPRPAQKPQPAFSQKIAATVIPAKPANNAAGSIKVPKPKRERKQPMPKQVPPALTPQLMPTQPPPLAPPRLLTIKKEPLEPKTMATATNTKPVASQFPDLHGLSITSAEELIMEQALEMEECGLYVNPLPAVDTDNAISSETAAALHFKIKNEFMVDGIKEEFISLKDASNRLLCSSLESSPFSSPASIELTPATPTVPTTTAPSAPNEIRVPATFYMPSFQLTSSSTLLANMSGSSSLAATTNTETPPTLSLAPLSARSQAHHQSQLPTAQTLINQIYLPMTVSGMPLLVQPNQMLPSVDTLLFSNANFFHSRGVAPTGTPQHNLS